MTKYAHLPALVDDNGVMVGYVDANGKERTLEGALIAPGTTPTPGGSVAWASITGVPAALTSAQAAGTPSIRAIGTTATTAMAGNTAIPALSSTAPAALAAAAAVGVGTTAARADHVHAFPAQIATGRTFALTGGATGTSSSFTGAANATTVVTLATPTASLRGGVLAQTPLVDSAAAPTQAEFNAVLAALRLAGVLIA